jgi:hypothetical protein
LAKVVDAGTDVADLIHDRLGAVLVARGGLMDIRHAEDVTVLVEDDFCDERRVGALKGID